MFIGRTVEIQKLINAYDSDRSEFVAVYGRRRVGKTYFVRETLGDKFTFDHAGLADSPMKRQLAVWQSSLRDAGLAKPRRPRSWIEAFDELKQVIENSSQKKKVIFIDEMPWMDTPHSGFVPALENFWNKWASARKDILLIICGSATSWIIDKVIKNHGGLHGRVTKRIYIQTFTLKECKAYASALGLGMNDAQIIECYMIMGGVPYYWSFLERGKSLAQNIDSLFFSRNGELYNEFTDLYASLFRNPDKYIDVITTLGTKKVGMTRSELIHEGKFEDNGGLSKILEELEMCGFIRKYNSIKYAYKDAVYQLVDEYTLFYLRFIRQNSRSDEGFWSHQQNSPVFFNWCGLAFERVCMNNAGQIKKALGISGVISNIYSWQSGNAQIDMLIDRDDNVIDLCEVKYTKDEFSVNASYHKALQQKVDRFVQDTHTRKAVRLVLISANGLARNEYYDDFQNVLDKDIFFDK